MLSCLLRYSTGTYNTSSLLVLTRSIRTRIRTRREKRRFRKPALYSNQVGIRSVVVSLFYVLFRAISCSSYQCWKTCVRVKQLALRKHSLVAATRHFDEKEEVRRGLLALTLHNINATYYYYLAVQKRLLRLRHRSRHYEERVPGLGVPIHAQSQVQPFVLVLRTYSNPK